jgi:hypothetical protein
MLAAVKKLIIKVIIVIIITIIIKDGVTVFSIQYFLSIGGTRTIFFKSLEEVISFGELSEGIIARRVLK